jgi:hypothetical protein
MPKNETIRHHPSHFPAFETVTHQRERDRTRTGDAEALQEPPGEHHRKGSRHQR